MLLVTVSKTKQLLYLSYAGHVSVPEIEEARSESGTLLADLVEGFRVLADLSRLESMDANCAAEIGKLMELCEQHGVGLVVRIIPNPAKDIGMDILTLFHYQRKPRIVTCKSLAEAEEILGLGPKG